MTDRMFDLRAYRAGYGNLKKLIFRTRDASRIAAVTGMTEKTAQTHLRRYGVADAPPSAPVAVPTNDAPCATRAETVLAQIAQERGAASGAALLRALYQKLRSLERVSAALDGRISGPTIGKLLRADGVVLQHKGGRIGQVVQYAGRDWTIRELAEAHGITTRALTHRLKKMPVAQAVTQPRRAW